MSGPGSKKVSYPEHMSYFRRLHRPIVFCSSFCIVINFFFNYDIKKLIMMQKLNLIMTSKN